MIQIWLIALAGGALVLILIIIFTVRAFSGGSGGTETTASKTPAATQPVGPTITIVALDTVRIKLVEEATGKELFQGTLVRGESRPFPKNGSLLLTATALENLEIEMEGRRFPTGEKGYSRIRIQ